jgi:drug/metabolite transporter (DMT)-like permease
MLSRKNSSEPFVGSKGSWKAGLYLFVYAITFSFAYVTLETGLGALILFGSVQITLISISLLTGNRLGVLEWVGVLIAFSGFSYLVLPTLSTPSVVGFILMAFSGVAWGLYTQIGRGSTNPLSDTTYNFLRTLPWVILLVALAFPFMTLTFKGFVLAVLSGSLTSGIGYTIWYGALRGLSSIQAAVVQLLVPAIAAIGGVLFANELISMRLVISSTLVLGGILLVILGKHRSEQH